TAWGYENRSAASVRDPRFLDPVPDNPEQEYFQILRAPLSNLRAYRYSLFLSPEMPGRLILEQTVYPWTLPAVPLGPPPPLSGVEAIGLYSGNE
ncbi:MAG TPA: hypothetical protein VE134_10135, partial [Methanomicrobiales archaeon]|nr:hypothetical protein [Methanomicrobiales archaeon]